MSTLLSVVAITVLCIAGSCAITQSDYSQADKHKLMGAMMALVAVVVFFVLLMVA